MGRDVVRLFRRKEKTDKEQKPRVQQPPISKRELLSAKPIRNPMIEWDKEEDGTVIIYLKVAPSRVERFFMGRASEERVKRIVLDEVGSFVWNLCDGQHTVNDIIEALSEKYKLRRIEAERSLLEFLKMLSQRMLVGFLLSEKK
ncbi:MAG: hypothetical protein DRJ51_05350 [Thermoprotei archaeon]|nr:MAG: hypothetical protein DRJ51_05350 [Thermoprotei archaeon]